MDIAREPGELLSTGPHPATALSSNKANSVHSSIQTFTVISTVYVVQYLQVSVHNSQTSNHKCDVIKNDATKRLNYYILVGVNLNK